MKFTTIIALALPVLALAAPVSDADWVSQHDGQAGEYEHPKHYEGPTQTSNPYPTQSVGYESWRRGEKVKKDIVPEKDYYDPNYDPYHPPAYPTQSVSYHPYKRSAKRNAAAQPEPAALPKPGMHTEAGDAAEVLTA